MMRKVAVYGSLRKGMGNHGLLLRGGAELIQMDKVHGYTMVSLGGFPALVPTGEYPNPITVEIYAVDDATFQNLDFLEGYPDFYNRCMLDGYPDPTWIYFIDEPELLNRTIVESGDWVEFKQEKAA